MLLATSLFFLVFFQQVNCKYNQPNSASLNSNATIQLAPLQPPPRSYWPTQGWRSLSPQKAGLNQKALQKLDTYAFSLSGTDKERKGVRTNSLLIVKDGFLAYEKYGRGFSKDKPHIIWSVSKCFVNTLFGIAQNQGLVDLDQPAYKYFSALNRPQKRAISIRHLLNMSSGIEWNEGYEYNPLKSSIIAMLYTLGRQDMPTFVAKQSMYKAPGTYAQYSSGNSNLLMGILRQVVGSKRYHSYPWDALFNRIGMDKVTWETDGSKNYVGSSYIFTRPRDLAKYGFLYLNNGKWAGQTILNESWIEFSRRPAPAYFTTPHYKGLTTNMSAHWYVNTGLPAANLSPSWPDAPKDTIACLGHWRQAVYVIPSLDMVVVRLADDRDGSYKHNTLLKLITESVLEK